MEAGRLTVHLHLPLLSSKPNTQSHPQLCSNPPAKADLCPCLQKIVKLFYSEFSPHSSCFPAPNYSRLSTNPPLRLTQKQVGQQIRWITSHLSFPSTSYGIPQSHAQLCSKLQGVAFHHSLSTPRGLRRSW